MSQPAIITVAITGVIARKADTPAVPMTPSVDGTRLARSNTEPVARPAEMYHEFDRSVASTAEARKLFNLQLAEIA
jgi:uncharacterized protein (DUF849 family)